MTKKQRAVPVEVVFKYRPPFGWWSGFTRAQKHRARFPKDEGPFAVTIRLAGNRFEFDSADPIWVGVDDGNCPPSDTGHSDICDVSANGTELTFTNENWENVLLRYQLNVVEKDTGTRFPIDPIMENEGRR